jgi:hypothetical protein
LWNFVTFLQNGLDSAGLFVIFNIEEMLSHSDEAWNLFSGIMFIWSRRAYTHRRQRNLVVCECSLQLAFLCHSNSLSRLDIAAITLQRAWDIEAGALQKVIKMLPRGECVLKNLYGAKVLNLICMQPAQLLTCWCEKPDVYSSKLKLGTFVVQFSDKIDANL